MSKSSHSIKMGCLSPFLIYICFQQCWHCCLAIKHNVSLRTINNIYIHNIDYVLPLTYICTYFPQEYMSCLLYKLIHRRHSYYIDLYTLNMSTFLCKCGIIWHIIKKLPLNFPIKLIVEYITLNICSIPIFSFKPTNTFRFQ